MITRPAADIKVVGAFLAFCALSSATYLVNDVRDREHDRLHPRKRHRPIAAGELSVRGALRFARVIAVTGVLVSVAVAPTLGLVAVGYLALTTSYSLLWRRVVVVDIVAIAGGFLLRAAAGGFATGVPISRSFLVATSACALFLAAGKRYAELVGAGDGGAGDRDGGRAAARVTLGRYSRRTLHWLLIFAAMLACLAYARWAFSRPTFGLWFELSMIPFGMWIGRYGMILGAGGGEAPEELIVGDAALMALSATWLLAFVGGVYGAP